MSEYVAFNFITGKDEPIPPPDSCSEAWLAGWEDGMRGYDVCPYIMDTVEASEWTEGFEAAKND